MNKVNTKLAMLAALAVELQRLPESARDLVNQPRFVRKADPGFIPPKDRKPNTNGMNRKLRRKLASMAVHGKLAKAPPVPKPAPAKLLPPSPTSVVFGLAGLTAAGAAAANQLVDE